jgi:hypothetical protein
MSLLAGALLIHCVAEDAFWLLSGLINGALRDYYPKEGNHGVRVDAAVFAGLLQGSEPKLAKLFKDTGVLRECRLDDAVYPDVLYLPPTRRAQVICNSHPQPSGS